MGNIVHIPKCGHDTQIITPQEVLGAAPEATNAAVANANPGAAYDFEAVHAAEQEDQRLYATRSEAARKSQSNMTSIF